MVCVCVCIVLCGAGPTPTRPHTRTPADGRRLSSTPTTLYKNRRRLRQALRDGVRRGPRAALPGAPRTPPGLPHAGAKGERGSALVHMYTSTRHRPISTYPLHSLEYVHAHRRRPISRLVHSQTLPLKNTHTGGGHPLHPPAPLPGRGDPGGAAPPQPRLPLRGAARCVHKNAGVS